MASMAMQYGGTIADQGKEYMAKNVSKTVHNFPGVVRS